MEHLHIFIILIMKIYLKNATIDIIIFRYCKDKKLPNKILFNDNEKYLINTNGIITFTDKVNKNLVKFSEIFDIYVGIVSE